MRFSLAVVLLLALLPVASPAGEITPRLAAAFERPNAPATLVAWVFFRDKGSMEGMRNAVPPEVVSARSLARRLKVRSADTAVDYNDLPIDSRYVEQVAATVRAVRQHSRWMNGVSVIATPEELRAVAQLPFVRTVDLVARFRRDASEQESGKAPPPSSIGSPTLLDYGPSLNQVTQIGVPAVHNTGNYGQGVIIGVFDNGFRLPNHQAFDQLQIIATYDFVDHKVSVVPNNPSSAFGSHGVNTLSTIGGYRPGSLIGPAFGATYILARTENDSSETPIEEDYWLAGIEWADSIGVDVTSTSLGYLGYDPPYTGWTWQDLDGNTTVITRAADMAASRGILVFNSAGNSGSNASHNTLVAPADGDSVVAMGAVGSTGTRVSFSSVGPTTSIPPRIKPDLMAQGSGVVVASSTNPSGYTTASGTSFSCPLGAGAGALVLSAHPAATPMQVLAALKATASNTASPNNLMGWGIINTGAAIDYLTANDVPADGGIPADFALMQNYPNPFNPVTSITFTLGRRSGTTPSAAQALLQVFDLLGREVATLVDAPMEPGRYTVQFDGSRLASGTYLYRLKAGDLVATRKLLLMK